MNTIHNFSEEEIATVIAEAEYAHKKWGTSFDDFNTLNDWAAYINIYAGEAVRMDNANKPDVQYAKFIKVANLALTAAYRVRTRTVASRHYDDALGTNIVSNASGANQ